MRDGHGDDSYRYQRPIQADFSSNVHPGGPSPALRARLAACIGCIGRYPEPGAESLARVIAEREGVASGQVLVTNGAVAAIYLIAQARRMARSRLIVPTFAEYEDAARLNDHAVAFTTRPALLEEGAEAGELVWLCNPNNPTGEAWDRATLLALVDRSPASTFVVDTSYAGFARAEPVRAADAASRDNLLLVHSLTKQFAIPGLRLGYLTGPAAAVQTIARWAPPWSVNALAIAAGEFVLKNPAPHLALDSYLAEAERWRAAIATLPDVRVRPSATGFFLIELARGTAAQLKAHLVDAHGLLIRDAANFRGLDRHHARLATQGRPENDRLTEALRAWRP
jgi:threonine-phosphate decarboxylase